MPLFFPFLFPPNAYLFTQVGDAISNLVFFNTKSLQYLLRSLPSLALLAVFSLVYAATGTELVLLHTSTFGRAQTSLCSNCGSKSQDIFLCVFLCLLLVVDCLALDSQRLTIFDPCLTILIVWFRPWMVVRLLVLCAVNPRPHP